MIILSDDVSTCGSQEYQLVIGRLLSSNGHQYVPMLQPIRIVGSHRRRRRPLRPLLRDKRLRQGPKGPHPREEKDPRPKAPHLRIGPLQHHPRRRH